MISESFGWASDVHDCANEEILEFQRMKFIISFYAFCECLVYKKMFLVSWCGIWQWGQGNIKVIFFFNEVMISLICILDSGGTSFLSNKLNTYWEASEGDCGSAEDVPSSYWWAAASGNWLFTLCLFFFFHIIGFFFFFHFSIEVCKMINIF